MELSDLKELEKDERLTETSFFLFDGEQKVMAIFFAQYSSSMFLRSYNNTIGQTMVSHPVA